jgi:hypothetical protein
MDHLLTIRNGPKPREINPPMLEQFPLVVRKPVRLHARLRKIRHILVML